MYRSEEIKLKALNRKLRTFVLTVCAVGAFAALAASPAMASEVFAKPSTSSIILTAKNITVKKNGAEAKTCEAPEKTIVGHASEGFAEIKSNFGDLQSYLTCASGKKFSLDFYLSTLYYDTTTGQYKLRSESALTGTYQSPFGPFEGQAGKPTGVWTNGSGTTNSTLTFPETVVGYLLSGGAKISFSGTFTVSTITGGLITLSH